MKKQKLEIADVFRQYRHLLRDLSAEKNKVIDAIVKCRTGELGTTIYQCDACGHIEISDVSCRNRHCPKCQYAAQMKWIEARTAEILPVCYFHLVFSIPHCFNDIALTNKEVFYGILFKAASKALRKLFRQTYAAEAGMIAILHTWGQNLGLHPHIHIIVPGGGINDENEWIVCKRGYYLSVKVLSKIFRGIFLKEIRKAYKQSKLEFLDVNRFLAQPSNFADLLDSSTKEEWVVYTKKPFQSPLPVLKYLGGYTHRIAFSNHRLIKIENDEVYFTYKDYKKNRKVKKVMKLHVVEFMRRFLMHILPRGFMRIRHYGILSNSRRKETIAIARSANKKLSKKYDPVKVVEEYKQEMTVLTDRCPMCKEGKMTMVEENSADFLRAQLLDLKRMLFESG